MTDEYIIQHGLLVELFAGAWRYIVFTAVIWGIFAHFGNKPEDPKI